MTPRSQRRSFSDGPSPDGGHAGVAVAAARFLVAVARMVALAQRGKLSSGDVEPQSVYAEQAAREAGAGQRSVRIVFAAGAAFVGGTPLHAASWAHECFESLELALREGGWSVIRIDGPIAAEEVVALAERIAAGSMETRAEAWSGEHVHLESANTEAFVSVARDIARDPSRLALAYGSALATLWEARSAMGRGAFPALPGLHRVAQLIVEIALAERVAFSQPTGRRLGGDESALGLDACLLAVSMMLRITDDRRLLRSIALAAMLIPFAPFDSRGAVRTSGGPPSVGRGRRIMLPRTIAGQASAIWFGIAGLSESARDVVVLAHETQLHRYRRMESEGTRCAAPTLPARVIACSVRFYELLAGTSARAQVDLDQVLITMEQEAGDEDDRLVHRLLLATLEVLPTGTMVQLTTGEVGAVRSPAREEVPLEPRVELLFDARGSALRVPTTVDLAAPSRASEPRRRLRRVVTLGHSASSHVKEDGTTAVEMDVPLKRPAARDATAKSSRPPLRRSSHPRSPSEAPLRLGPEILAGFDEPSSDKED